MKNEPTQYYSGDRYFTEHDLRKNYYDRQLQSELNELTAGKSLKALQDELAFQIKNGESMGGTICSHIQNQIEFLKNNPQKATTFKITYQTQEGIIKHAFVGASNEEEAKSIFSEDSEKDLINGIESVEVYDMKSNDIHDNISAENKAQLTESTSNINDSLIRIYNILKDVDNEHLTESEIKIKAIVKQAIN